jgi:hypothetical protein
MPLWGHSRVQTRFMRPCNCPPPTMRIAMYQRVDCVHFGVPAENKLPQWAVIYYNTEENNSYAGKSLADPM